MLYMRTKTILSRNFLSTMSKVVLLPLWCVLLHLSLAKIELYDERFFKGEYKAVTTLDECFTLPKGTAKKVSSVKTYDEEVWSLFNETECQGKRKCERAYARFENV